MSQNPYLDLLDEEEKRVKTADTPTATPPANPYLQVLEQDEALKRTQQRAALRTAVPVNPDQAAQARQIAGRRNLPDDLVLRNLQDVALQDAVDRADDRLLTSPALADKVRDMSFARVAHDNIENLADIEQRIKTFGEFKPITGPAPTAASWAKGQWQSLVGGAQMIREGMRMHAGDLLGLPIDDAKKRYAQAEFRADLATPEFESATARGIYGGVASTLRVIPGVAASILTRSPVPVLASMGVQTEAEAYGKYRERGATKGQALVGAAGEAIVEVGTGMWPMGFLVQTFGKVGAKEFLAGMLGRELPTEQIATVLQDAIDTAVANPDKTWGDYLNERPAAAYQTLLATLVQSGVMGGASSAVKRIAERDKRVQEDSERGKQYVADLLKMAEKDKLRERDPQVFAELVQKSAEHHGAPAEVFIDANALVETLAQKGMAPEAIEAALPSAKKQLAEALASGGDVAVPVGEFTALVSGQDFAPTLLQHVRASPDSLSEADAKLLAKTDIKGEAAKQAAQADADLEAQATSVRSRVVAQLDEAGRFSPAVNAAYADSVAAFYDTQAARLGITADEMFKRYPLTIKSAGVFGEQSLEQSGKAPKKWRLMIQRAVKRGNLDGERPVMQWQVDKNYKAFDTAAEARRALMEDLDPALKGKPDYSIKQHYDRRQRNVGGVKLAREDDGTLAQGDNWARLNTELNALLDANPETAAAYRALNRARLAAQASNWSEDDSNAVTAAEEAFFAMPEAERISDLAAQRDEAAAAEGTSPAAPGDQPFGPAPYGLKATFTPSTNTITLLAKADLSSFLHETGHFYLEVLADMASQPDAPAPIAQDTQTVLDWFGFKGTIAEWRALSIDQRRDMHEQFARGFEAYLLEGKAPSIALSRVFGRFRAWLVNIYKSIRSLDVELNDDIRRVFDRLLATDEAIKEAEAARAYAPLFADEKTLKEAGVDPASYHALGAEATAEAIDQLAERSMRDMKWLANAKGRALKAVQKEAAELREGIEAEVREEVGRMPVYAAENFLRRGVLPETDRNNAQRKALDATQGMNTKLDLAALKGMYGEDPAALWRYLPTGKTGLATAKDGLPPDVVAEIFGFPSGDMLVRELLAAEPQAQVIEGMTDQRMLERHGELSSPEALERAAEAAIHNEARGKFIATELNALNKAVGPVRVLVAAAKQFAEQVIGAKTITDIKPHVFVAAETRAAKLAEKALGKSTEEAATAKRNQLLNHYAARYAAYALREVERIQTFFKRVADTPDDRLKSRDIDVVNAARAVLAGYGVGRKGEAATAYLEKVAAYDPDMSNVLRASVDAALQNAKPLEQLTLDELRALHDEVEALWYLAESSRQMEVDGDLMDREDVQDAIKDRLQEIGIPDTMPGDTSAITPAEERLAKLKTYLASARRMESWVEAMDGDKTGAFRRLIWQPVKEAADAYRADKVSKLGQLRALLKPIEKTLNKRLIAAPELGYTFGKDTGGVAMNEILHAVLHTGNESNKRKLLLGRKWATENADGTLDTSKWDAFIQRMVKEGVIEKAHFDFAQGVWDLLESTKPLAQKTHRAVFGKYFAEVTADSFVDPFGTTRAGGYAPALADPRIVSDAKTKALAQAENDSLIHAFPTTNKGFTKGRVEYNRPLMLDLGTLAQHLDKVLLFSHLERPVRDVRRVLTSKGVAYGVNRIDPAAFDSIIDPWLHRAAKQIVTDPKPGHWQSWRLWSVLRNRAGMAAMFGNVVNAAQQVTGFSIAAVKVGPKHLLGAMGHYITHPRQLANDVAEASPYMEGRMRNEVAAMNDQIKDILIDPGLYERTQQWTMRHAYFLQSAVDNVMSPIIWLAARNQALEEGHSDRDAVRLADSAVRQTQGSTLPEDISNWEAGSSFSRMFSQFAGYFNMQANLLGTEFQTISRDMGLRKGFGRGLYVLVLGFLAPAWVSEMIVQAFRGGPDDEDKDGEYLDDWLQAVFGMATLRGATAMVPIFGQGANALVNASNNKPYDDRLATSPAISMIESGARAVAPNGSVYKAAFEDGDKSRAVKDVASLISLTTGIPANIAARPLSYMVDVQEGDVTPTSPADAVRGAITGRASPDSR